jgi:hypothetical protein
MDPNALSIATRGLRSHLAPALDIGLPNILIGHPAAAQEVASSATAGQFLNLFPYRIEPGGFPSAGLPEDPYYFRLFCLITALGRDEQDSEGNSISAGEIELRLLGAILARLHQQPTLLLRRNGEALSELQIVPTPLTLEALNNLWSTQKELPYRLSVAYELALLPVPLARPGQPAPLVVEVRVPEPTLGTRAVGQVEIAFADERGDLHPALLVEPSPTPLRTRLVAAGPEGAPLRLAWERWTSGSGFSPVAAPPADAVPVDLRRLTRLDAPASHGVEVSLDVSTPGQIVVFGRQSDGPTNRLVVVIAERRSPP